MPEAEGEAGFLCRTLLEAVPPGDTVRLGCSPPQVPRHYPDSLSQEAAGTAGTQGLVLLGFRVLVVAEGDGMV